MVALARKRPRLLLEEKVSPVRPLVTDVVENATNSPAVSEYRTFYRTPHQSQIGSEEPICASFSSRRRRGRSRAKEAIQQPDKLKFALSRRGIPPYMMR